MAYLLLNNFINVKDYRRYDIWISITQSRQNGKTDLDGMAQN